MELDKKVREFPLPEGMKSGVVGKEDMVTSFERCVLDHARETGELFGLLFFLLISGSFSILNRKSNLSMCSCLVLMYIHRSFFAQAIIENPGNPLKSAYAPSFLAAYRASSTILTSIKEQFKLWPISCSRFWVMWTFAFSAAVR